MIATGLFVIVICTVATDDRAPWKGVMAPLLIGLFIFTAADAIGPASGGSFNPARSLDPGDLQLELQRHLDLPRRAARRRRGRRSDLVDVRADPVHEPATIRATGGVPQAHGAQQAQTRSSAQTASR